MYLSAVKSGSLSRYGDSGWDAPPSGRRQPLPSPPPRLFIERVWHRGSAWQSKPAPMILRGAKIILFLACTLETRIAARVYIAAWKAPLPRPGHDRWAAWLRRRRGMDIWREGKAITSIESSPSRGRKSSGRSIAFEEGKEAGFRIFSSITLFFFVILRASSSGSISFVLRAQRGDFFLVFRKKGEKGREINRQARDSPRQK